MTTTLSPLDGHDVFSTAIKVINAGDGLSKALAVDPEEFHLGEKVYVVLECDVSRVAIEPIKDAPGVTRVHTLKAGTATVVDESLVRQHLDEQERRIEAAAGVQRLPLAGEDPDPADEEGTED